MDANVGSLLVLVVRDVVDDFVLSLRLSLNSGGNNLVLLVVDELAK